MVTMCMCSHDSKHACYGYSKYRVTEQSLDLNTVKKFFCIPKRWKCFTTNFVILKNIEQ